MLVVSGFLTIPKRAPRVASSQTAGATNKLHNANTITKNTNTNTMTKTKTNTKGQQVARHKKCQKREG